MKKLNSQIIFFLIIFVSLEINSMIDNRFLPLYRPEYTREVGKRTILSSNIFFLIGEHARNDIDDKVLIPEMNGRYNLANIAKALEITGKPNPLAPQWQSLLDIPWTMEGKLEGAGWWFGYEQAFLDHWALGISTYLFTLNSKQNFILPNKTIRELRLDLGGEIELRQDQLQANKLLGISDLQFNKNGISDIDLYLRFGTIKEYIHKFRKVDCGLTLGILFPTGELSDINIPSSIPFGANGHFGIYGRADVDLELKDDLTVGLWLEVCHRVEKTKRMRLPVAGELQNFGALIANVNVDPGLTVGVKPWIALTDIQDGVGFKAGYTIVHHNQDCFRISEEVENNYKIDLSRIRKESGWLAEYANFRLMYDFSRSLNYRCFAPLIYIDWDMPASIFGAHRVVQTNRVSVGFEINF